MFKNPKSEKVLSRQKIYFKHEPCGVVPCVCIQLLSCDKVEGFQKGFKHFRFELIFQISKLNLRFQINLPDFQDVEVLGISRVGSL